MLADVLVRFGRICQCTHLTYAGTTHLGTGTRTM
jgi:hypothetical protein